MLRTIERPTYQIGDVVPAYSPRCPYRPGRSRWHALKVYPQRERAAKAWLGRWSIDAFFPVLPTTTWRNGKSITQERPYLPGYLFANFPGDPLWHWLFDRERRLVHDVLRMSDGITPGELHPYTLVRLEAMRGLDEDIERRRQISRALRKGDRAKLAKGPLAGQVVEIVSVDAAAGRAKFDLRLFGSVSPGEADLGILDKVEPT